MGIITKQASSLCHCILNPLNILFLSQSKGFLEETCEI
jgi:hypothetical protein